MTDFERLRVGMVDTQIRPADVTDHEVIRAFLIVPRENHVPEGRAALAYLDARVPLGAGGRATLDPMTLAKLVQLAAPKPGEKVLVVGCGLGYSAAILAQLAGEVTALECDATLASEAKRRLADLANVVVIEGPLADGAPSRAPFDLIFCDGLVTGGLDMLGDQLAPNGRIVAPAGGARASKATVFRRRGDTLAASTSFDAAGPALPGLQQVEAFVF